MKPSYITLPTATPRVVSLDNNFNPFSVNVRVSGVTVLACLEEIADGVTPVWFAVPAAVNGIIALNDPVRHLQLTGPGTAVIEQVGGSFDSGTAAGTGASAPVIDIAAFRATPDNGSWTYSNSNKTVLQAASPTVGLVRSAQPIVGKQLWAVHVDAEGNVGYPLIGIVDGVDHPAQPGFDSTSWGAMPVDLHRWFTNTSNTGFDVPTNWQGTVIGLAIDQVAKRMWMTQDGINYYGPSVISTVADVGSGIGGIDYSGQVGSVVYPCVGAGVSGSKQFTVVPWPWAKPTGFTQLSATPTNILLNGDFASGTANWTGFGFSGKAVTGGKAVFTATPVFDGITQTPNPPLIAGKYYDHTMTISGYSAGTIYGYFTGGTGVSGATRSANGTYTERLQAQSGNTIYGFQANAGPATMSIDDISLVGPYDTP